MTPDKNFKMKKTTKVLIASLTRDAASYNELKRVMIDAQLHEEAAKRASLKSKDTSRSRGAVAPD